MTIAAFFFKSTEKFSRILNHSFSGKSTTVFQARDTLVLAPGAYDAFRESVRTRLGDQASMYVEEIDL